MRWSLKLQNLDFTVEYKPGSKNTAADYLSRRPYKPEQRGAGTEYKGDSNV
jgi:hypothetical protein